ncbi:leucine-rich repeat receptor-like protein kinase TDR [Vicia villosa]|uniref:leucine-rich repeat receptor-like protein kinase TDR n=1 Tax=Vicia villosa TaxID=3911 RepID=UPI00273BFFC5|nr:leucine-rich repeat receptor-like protein kinase TDR [Vicia villosa]
MELLNFFVILLTIFGLTSSSPLRVDSYTRALLKLKSELQDDHNSLKDWVVPSVKKLHKSGSLYACTWSGIKCDNHSIVTSIDLSRKKLEEELSNLTRLQSLFLFKNQLEGSIPSELAKIKSLTDLDLRYNFLSGSISESFSKLKHLRLFNVSFNDISGSIPKGKVLKLMDKSNFIGNPKLCGAPLKPCLVSMGSITTLKFPQIVLLFLGLLLH